MFIYQIKENNRQFTTSMRTIIHIMQKYMSRSKTQFARNDRTG